MGREAIYRPEMLEIGEKLELKGKVKKYSWQYLTNFNKRNKEMKFKHVRENKRVFIERIK